MLEILDNSLFQKDTGKNQDKIEICTVKKTQKLMFFLATVLLKMIYKAPIYTEFDVSWKFVEYR